MATPTVTRRSRKGRRFVVVLGALAAIGAFVAVLLRRQDDATDPWAQPYPTYPPSPVQPSTTPSTAINPSEVEPVTPGPLDEDGPGADDEVGGSDDEDDAQRPETDIADIAPGEHSVTDDGGRASDEDKA